MSLICQCKGNPLIYCLKCRPEPLPDLDEPHRIASLMSLRVGIASALGFLPPTDADGFWGHPKTGPIHDDDLNDVMIRRVARAAPKTGLPVPPKEGSQSPKDALEALENLTRFINDGNVTYAEAFKDVLTLRSALSAPPVSLPEGLPLSSHEPMSHRIKCHPAPFKAIREGIKGFEYRALDDRPYQVGDTLEIAEWDPATKEFTGEVEIRPVDYMLTEGFGIPHGYCIMSWFPAAPLGEAPKPEAPVIPPYWNAKVEGDKIELVPGTAEFHGNVFRYCTAAPEPSPVVEPAPSRREGEPAIIWALVNEYGAVTNPTPVEPQPGNSWEGNKQWRYQKFVVEAPAPLVKGVVVEPGKGGQP